MGSTSELMPSVVLGNDDTGLHEPISRVVLVNKPQAGSAGHVKARLPSIVDEEMLSGD